MRILFVDDEPQGRRVISSHLERELGHEVTQCGSGEEALALFRQRPFPMVLTDIRMPGMDGIELLRRIKSGPEGGSTDVLLITAHGDMESAITALREGAYDYLNKPVDLVELEAIVRRSAEHRSLIHENFELTHHFEERVAEATRDTHRQMDELLSAFAEAAGVARVGIFSSAMQEVVDMAQRLHQDRHIPVLIEGETGTGKEIVARMIHYGAGGVTTPFVAINCAAISPSLFESELFGYERGAFTGARTGGQMGKLELARGGTLFLDEIAEMPLNLQPKLLRVLQEREFYRVGGLKKISLDLRVICTSNRDLAAMVESGAFRRDLYYRLNIGRIHLSPLRERREEIGKLAFMFMARFAESRKRRFRVISPEALNLLERYPWPGNVRELENTIERVVLIHDAETLQPGHLDFLWPAATAQPAGSGARDPERAVLVTLPEKGFSLEGAELVIIRRILDMFGGNKSHAAEYLGITRSTLRLKLDKHSATAE
ncbi:sigma-54 dependent transcriptional regulator [bacterium]|nr:sigma-54 dependent transcriptional regulator [bacterium]